MNYWPTMSTNLAECLMPFSDYVESLRAPGRIAAAAAYGIKSGEGEENGWLVGCFSTAFGYAAMAQKGNLAGWNPTGSAWALQNMYEYYLYTGDTNYLKNTLYPSMKEVAKFWSEALWWSDYQQRYVSGPSYSPENGPIVNGASYDQEFVWQHFENTIQAAETLGVDADLVKTWKDLQSKLNPVLIGKDGQVKEWFEETSFGKAQAGSLPETAIPGWRDSLGAGNIPHRHISQLVGLYPGTLINKDNTEYMNAAMVTLNERGLDATGWSKAHKLNLWARTGKANEAFQLVQSSVGGGNTGILTNLFCSHGGGANYMANPIFQIDGNFGLTAGVSEMLLQSQLGYTQFLPCLPTAWADGSVKGLVSRGNFVIDMAWSNGAADKLSITSRNGGEFIGEYNNLSGYTVQDSKGASVETTALGKDKISFATEKGETYTINFSTASKLDVQINVGQNLEKSMTDARLATAKAALEDAIATAKSVAATGSEEQKAAAADVMAAANATANKSMEFLAVIEKASAFYAEKESLGATRSQVKTALVKLSSEIEKANALLNSKSATEADFLEKTAALEAAKSEVTNIVGVLSTFDAKLAEAQAFYAEKESMGSVWLAAEPLLKNLSDTISAAKNLLQNTGATAGEFTSSAAAMNEKIAAVKTLIGSINLSASTAGGTLTLTSSDSQFEVRYTLDGNTPSPMSKLYEEPVPLPKKNITIRAALFVDNVKLSKEFTFKWNGGNLATGASEVAASSGSNYARALDGDESTVWSSDYGAEKPVTLTLNFAKPVVFDQAEVKGADRYEYYHPTSIAIDYWDAAAKEGAGDWVELGADSNFYPKLTASFAFPEVTTTKVRLRVLDYQYYSLISEFQISSSKSDMPVDLTELKDLLTEAAALKEGTTYLNADSKTKEAFDNCYALAAEVAKNTASDAETVKSAMNALLDVMATLNGVTPEKALEILREQLAAATELSGTLSGASLAETRNILEDVISAAWDVKTQKKEALYYTTAIALKNAIARTEQAVKLVGRLSEVKPFHKEYTAKAGEWTAAKKLLDDLSAKIKEAESMLANPTSAAKTLRQQINKLSPAADAVTDLFTSASVTIKLADGSAVMTPSDSQFEIRYTLDGNMPSLISKTYADPVKLPNRGLTIKAAAFVGSVQISQVATKTVVGENLALNKTASSDAADWGGEYIPAAAVDGDLDTRWASKTSTPSFTVDLGASHQVCQVAVRQIDYPRISGFEIMVSADGKEDSWTKAYTESAAKANAVYEFEPVSAQFVKLVVTSANREVTVNEFEVYAVPEASEPVDRTALDAALAKAETAKTDGTYANAHKEMKALFDYYYDVVKAVSENEKSDADTVKSAAEAITAAIGDLSKQRLTVTSGSGSGFYKPGETVTIIADEAPANKRFDAWRVVSGGVKLADATARKTTFVMPAESVEVTAGYDWHFSGGGSTTPTKPAEVQFPFTDVAESTWYYKSVKAAWEKKLIDGVSDDRFQPDNTLTVAQAIKLAAALHQMNADGKVTLTNGAKAWYDTYVNYAVQKRIIEASYQDFTAVQMNAPVSRAEFVHIFYGAMPESSYPTKNTVGDNKIPDVKLTDKYGNAIYTFYRAGILTGSDAAGTFHAENSIRRSEVAAITIRMFDAAARQNVTLK